MIHPDKYYVIDKNRGIAIRQHRRPADGYSDLFSWEKPQIRARGMTREEADNFITRYSETPGCSELAIFQGKDFVESSFEDFCSSVFQKIDVYAEYNGVRRRIFSNLPKWAINLDAWKYDNPELSNWDIKPATKH